MEKNDRNGSVNHYADKTREELILEIADLKKENEAIKEQNGFLLSASAVPDQSVEDCDSKKELVVLWNKYLKVIENLSDVIFEIDETGMIRYVSPSVHKTLGYTQSEVIGKMFYHFFGEGSGVVMNRFKELPEKKSINSEYKIKGRDGRNHWIRNKTLSVTGGLTIISMSLN